MYLLFKLRYTECVPVCRPPLYLHYFLSKSICKGPMKDTRTKTRSTSRHTPGIRGLGLDLCGSLPLPYLLNFRS